MTTSQLACPLVIDLDHALLRNDLRDEQQYSAIAARFGAQSGLTVAALPYDEDVLALLKRAQAEGRSTRLVTSQASEDALAIARHLGMCGVIVAPAQREATLAAQFADTGFDYVGRDGADLPTWRQAEHAYGVRLDPHVSQSLARLRPDAQIKVAHPPGWRCWLKALRIHQYAKNLLIFVPMFTAHDLGAETWEDAVVAFIAFCLCASGVYVLNDLVDLAADRAHPSKRRRPFASGALPLASGPPLVAALVFGAFTLALLLPVRFLICLLGYLVLTTAYTFWLKRKMAVDVVVLALLYTTRILAGGYATYVVVSEWLLAFSTFIFTALALMKRYVELVALLEHKLQDPKNRDYKRSDLPVIAALAAASAMNSVTIFALYLSSTAVVTAYGRPRALWLMCPLLLYWLLRALMMAHRGTMDDDPVIFALRDRTSWLTIGCMVVVFMLAL